MSINYLCVYVTVIRPFCATKAEWEWDKEAKSTGYNGMTRLNGLVIV